MWWPFQSRAETILLILKLQAVAEVVKHFETSWIDENYLMICDMYVYNKYVYIYMINMYIILLYN